MDDLGKNSFESFRHGILKTKNAMSTIKSSFLLAGMKQFRKILFEFLRKKNKEGVSKRNKESFDDLEEVLELAEFTETQIKGQVAFVQEVEKICNELESLQMVFEDQALLLFSQEPKQPSSRPSFAPKSSGHEQGFPNNEKLPRLSENNRLQGQVLSENEETANLLNSPEVSPVFFFPTQSHLSKDKGDSRSSLEFQRKSQKEETSGLDEKSQVSFRRKSIKEGSFVRIFLRGCSQNLFMIFKTVMLAQKEKSKETLHLVVLIVKKLESLSRSAGTKDDGQFGELISSDVDAWVVSMLNEMNEILSRVIENETWTPINVNSPIEALISIQGEVAFPGEVERN